MRVDEINMNNLISKVEVHQNKELKESKKDEEILDEKKIDNLVKKMNEKADNLERGIRFEKEHKINRWIIKVYDNKSGEVIRQIPNEESVKLAKAMDDIIGNILDMKF